MKTAESIIRRGNRILHVDESIPAFVARQAVNTRCKYAAAAVAAESVAPVAIQPIKADPESEGRELAAAALVMLRDCRSVFGDLHPITRADLISLMVKYGQWARLAITLKVVAASRGVIKWTVDPDNFCRFSCPSITRPGTGLHHHVELDPDTGNVTCDCEYGQKASAENSCVHIGCFFIDCLPGITARIATSVAVTAAAGSMADHLTRFANDRGLLTPERDF